MSTADRRRLFGEFAAAWLRRFRRKHPDVKVLGPHDGTISKAWEVTDAAGILTVYQSPTDMIADLQDQFRDMDDAETSPPAYLKD